MRRLKKQTRAGGAAFSGARSRTLHSRPPLSRFQEIFHAIKTGRYPNRTQLARSIEVTTKTIQRDLDYMRYQLNLPIVAVAPYAPRAQLVRLPPPRAQLIRLPE